MTGRAFLWRARSIGALALGAILFALSATTLRADQPIPPYTASVVDQTATLSPGDVQDLDSHLRDFTARRGSQVAVLMVPTTQPETIEQFSIRVAEAWKVGRAKTDDGVIVVVAKNDRALRIEVGYGLEGVIPDAVAKRIISEHMAPHFRNGDFAGGLRDGTGMLMKLIEGESLPPPSYTPPEPNASAWDLIVPLFVAVAVGSTLASLFGRLFGAGLGALGFAAAAWTIVGVFWMSVVGGLFAFLLILANGSQPGRGRGWHSGGGGWGGSSGGWSGGSSGGFGGGGGGSFGGGGASGNW
jgi:uncharacterized protein